MFNQYSLFLYRVSFGLTLLIHVKCFYAEYGVFGFQNYFYLRVSLFKKFDHQPVSLFSTSACENFGSFFPVGCQKRKVLSEAFNGGVQSETE